jgi:small subunit ribosomal protein S8
MHTDPIADYLTRIRNAIRAGHDEVEIPLNGLKLEMCRILKEQGYIKDFSRKPAAVGENINVELKYTGAATSITRASPASTVEPGPRSSALRSA